jgi:hypothetical protein
MGLVVAHGLALLSVWMGMMDMDKTKKKPKVRPARVLISGPSERSCLPSNWLHNKNTRPL